MQTDKKMEQAKPIMEEAPYVEDEDEPVIAAVLDEVHESELAEQHEMDEVLMTQESEFEEGELEDIVMIEEVL